MNMASEPSASVLAISTNAAACPLNDGLAVIDQLLAAILREKDSAAFDLALDFRLLLARSSDPDLLLPEFFRLREQVEERHYLALYRLRRWLEASYVGCVRLDRTRPIREVNLRLDTTSFRALCARCAFDAADGELVTAWVRVSFGVATKNASISS